MKRYSDRFLRIAFFIERSTKLTREWFRGTMLYTRHNPKWFVRMFELGNGITERGSTANQRGSGRLVALACDYIAKNACRKGGIDQWDVAKHFGVSVRTLQLRFKEAAFTHSILNEIQRVQLENVCRMLRSTKRSIKDITFASGFGSLSRLKAIFVRKFGVSMREYRNMAKNATLPLKVKK